MAANLKRLSNIISSAVDNIDSRCSELDLTFPSLDEPVWSDSKTLAPQQDDLILQAIAQLVSAATQLIATAKVPVTYVFNAACMYYLPATLRVATETHIAEILREAGPNGLHVDQIGLKNGIDPKKLSRILRYLAVHHIFKEIKPDVFAVNRLSSVIDTGKAWSGIRTDPLRKHDDTSGVAALVGHCSDEDFKGTAYILEHLTNPETALASNPYSTPLMQAVNYKGSFWSWLEEPDNIMRLKRFGCAMNGVSNVQPPDAILKGYGWESLPPNSLVVDVGGGIGVSTMALAKSYPELRFIVQDRPAIVMEGLNHWRSSFPEALDSGQVQFQEHDFFLPQPIRQPSVFLLKQISHDWADSYVIRILSNLRAAAGDLLQDSSSSNEVKTKLVLIDCIVPYACPVSEIKDEIPGMQNSDSIPPLLPNLVDADPCIYYTDLSMYVHFNGQERTFHHLDNVLRAAGWKIVHVFAFDGQGYYPQIVADPI